jgi:hypothetical protein
MKKIAIFVEGQTELIFVREFLLKKFGFQNISIECYTLFIDSKNIPTEYAFETPNPTHNFHIFNVGNDNAVLTRILNRENYLWNQGFSHIIGLRDMYSKNYRETNQLIGEINPAINLKFIESVQHQISIRAKKPNQISFHYAIMEAEAWILGLKNCFLKLDELLTNDYILETIGINLTESNPETAFYHPAGIIEKIYNIAEKNYNKSKSDINAIMRSTDIDDFLELLSSDKCDSFKKFNQSIESTL